MKSQSPTASAPATGTQHPITTIAAALNAPIEGNSDLMITGVNALDRAGPSEITFIGSARHAAQWRESLACAALVTKTIEVPGHDPAGRALIPVPDADLALAEVLVLFAPPARHVKPGVHPTAHVDATATVDSTASVGPNSTIGAYTTIGAGTVLEGGVHVGDHVRIGDYCTLRAGVVIRSRCVLHDRVSVHSNAVIGADGFGYRPDGQGGLRKLEHIGTVEIHNDVEIGASTTIDRGKFGKTVIGPDSKLDNLVQIGHNVRIGRGCVLASQTGIAGSSVLGDYCRLGAKSGVADHRSLGNRVQLAATTGIMHDAPDDATLAGTPAIDIRRFWRVQAALHKLPALLKTIARLEEDVNQLKSPDDPEAP